MVGSKYLCLPVLEKQEKAEEQWSGNEEIGLSGTNQSIYLLIPQTFVECLLIQHPVLGAGNFKVNKIDFPAVIELRLEQNNS